jgi:hypothetical protein
MGAAESRKVVRGSGAQTSFWFLSSLQHRLKYRDNCRIYDEQARTENEADNAYFEEFVTGI